MLYNRVISAIVLIPMVVAMIFFSSVVQFSIFILIICLVSAWEWGKLMKFSLVIHYIWMFFMFSLLCTTMIMIIQNCLCFNNDYIFLGTFGVVTAWWMFAYLLTLFYPNFTIFWSKNNIFCFCFGMLMIIPFFCGILILYQFHYFNDCLNGKWWLFCILVLVWVNDSSAYFIGKKLGRYKLLEYISPKKTWEGCIGGVCISVQLAWIFSQYIVINDNYRYIVFISYIGALVFAVIGDLVESMFKRVAGVKDTSSLIPGHGGLLDRIDSLMAAIPIFVMLILFLMYMNNVFEF